MKLSSLSSGEPGARVSSAKTQRIRIGVQAVSLLLLLVGLGRLHLLYQVPKSFYDANFDQIIALWNWPLIYSLGVDLMFIGLGTYGALLWPSRVLLRPATPRPLFICLALGLFVTGVVLRILWLDLAPIGLYQDDAVNAIEAVHSLSWAWPPQIWSGNLGGRGTLYLFWLRLVMEWAGAGIWGLRLGSVIIASLTLVGVFLLARFYRSLSFAIFALGVISVSRWHLTYSRIPWEAIAVPFFQVWSLTFLEWGRSSQRPARKLLILLVSGALFALGCYTYVAYRAFIPVYAFFVLMMLFDAAGGNSRHWRVAWSVSIGAGVLLTLLPLVSVCVSPENPCMQRFREVSIFLHGETVGIIPAIVNQVAKHLLMFHVQGDFITARHNIPFSPLLDPMTGSFVLIGIIVSLVRRERWDVLIVVWALVCVVAGSLSSEAPHATRVIGALIPITLLGARGVEVVFERLCVFCSAGSLVPQLLTGFFFSVALLLSAADYFLMLPSQATAYIDFQVRAKKTAMLAALLHQKGVRKIFIGEELAYHSSAQILFLTNMELGLRNIRFEAIDERERQELFADTSATVLLVASSEEADQARATFRNRIRIPPFSARDNTGVEDLFIFFLDATQPLLSVEEVREHWNVSMNPLSVENNLVIETGGGSGSSISSSHSSVRAQ